jgi:hypothetical protein
LGSAPILWGAWKQGLISRNTAEAETVAAFDCHQEAQVTLRTLQQLCLVAGIQPPPPCLYIKEDNQAVISQITHKGISTKARYIGVKSAWLRQQYKQKLLNFDYVKTGFQCADVLTKPLAAEPHLHLCALLMGHAPSDQYTSINSTATRLPAAYGSTEGVC